MERGFLDTSASENWLKGSVDQIEGGATMDIDKGLGVSKRSMTNDGVLLKHGYGGEGFVHVDYVITSSAPDISSISRSKRECELLHQPQTKFLVTKIEQNHERGSMVVHMTEVTE